MGWFVLAGVLVLLVLVLVHHIGRLRGKKDMLDILEEEHDVMCRHCHSLTTNELVAILKHRYLGKPSNSKEIWIRRAQELERRKHENQS